MSSNGAARNWDWDFEPGQRVRAFAPTVPTRSLPFSHARRSGMARTIPRRGLGLPVCGSRRERRVRWTLRDRQRERCGAGASTRDRSGPDPPRRCSDTSRQGAVPSSRARGIGTGRERSVATTPVGSTKPGDLRVDPWVAPAATGSARAGRRRRSPRTASHRRRLWCPRLVGADATPGDPFARRVAQASCGPGSPCPATRISRSWARSRIGAPINRSLGPGLEPLVWSPGSSTPLRRSTSIAPISVPRISRVPSLHHHPPDPELGRDPIDAARRI